MYDNIVNITWNRKIKTRNKAWEIDPSHINRISIKEKVYRIEKIYIKGDKRKPKERDSPTQEIISKRTWKSKAEITRKEKKLAS